MTAKQPRHETSVAAIDELVLSEGERHSGREDLAGTSRAHLRSRPGMGFAGRHHGEILQGAWRPPSVRGATEPVPCLVTMPVPEHGTRVQFVRGPGAALEVEPAWKVKAARAARLALDFLGERRSGGRLTVDCPVPPGLGLGSSTSDVVAAIRAVCDAHGTSLEPRQLARLAVETEHAIDPIMFDEGVLFAPRQGRVLEHWQGALPEFFVVSVDTDPQRGGIDTLSLAVPRYTAAELAEYEELICRARSAFRARDARAMAGVATRSAELNQRFLPMRGFADLRALAQQARCLGLQISHSGTVAGFLFDSAARDEAQDRLRPALRALGMRCLGAFRTGATRAAGN